MTQTKRRATPPKNSAGDAKRLRRQPPKRPSTPRPRAEGRTASGTRAGYWTVEHLEARGVEVRRCSGPLGAEERETGVSFLEAERMAEVTTANSRWMKRIESLGHLPSVVNVFEGGGEIRVYSIPKRLVKLPSGKGKE